jgi:hypothetical protein
VGAKSKVRRGACEKENTMKIRCYDIKWDTDGEDVDLPSVDLPSEVFVDINTDDEDADLETLVNEQGADALSDLYGWCVLSYQWEEEK